MRTIKFRAWDKNKKKLLNVRTLLFDRELNQTKVVLCNCPDKDFPSKDFILMQFTGLFDKNKVEIWERDVIRVVIKNKYLDQDYLGEIKWIEKGGAFYVADGPRGVVLFSMLTPDQLEVIGNIYERLHRHENTDILNTCQKELKDFKKDTKPPGKPD